MDDYVAQAECVCGVLSDFVFHVLALHHERTVFALAQVEKLLDVVLVQHFAVGEVD